MCPYCPAIFKSKQELAEHIISHGIRGSPANIMGFPEDNYKCKQCNKGFVKHGSIERHNNTLHDGKTLIQCLKCHIDFTQKSDLDNHIVVVHKGESYLIPHFFTE